LLCTTRVVAASSLLYLSEIASNRVYSGWDLSKYFLQNLKKVAEKITQITIISSTLERIITDPQKCRGKRRKNKAPQTTFFSAQRVVAASSLIYL
jgi:hypothetical protein